MPGGIQPGTVATDKESKKIDRQLKSSYEILSKKYDKHFLSLKKLNNDHKIKYVGNNCFGFAPDGGAWFNGEILVACFEAKKQGYGGNAHERWWDNAVTAKYINEDVIYVTFCVGDGAKKDGCLEKLSRKAKIMMGENYKFYLSPNGFTENEIVFVMEETLKTIITKYNISKVEDETSI
jgi:hypothetical protein